VNVQVIKRISLRRPQLVTCVRTDHHDQPLSFSARGVHKFGPTETSPICTSRLFGRRASSFRWSDVTGTRRVERSRFADLFVAVGDAGERPALPHLDQAPAQLRDIATPQGSASAGISMRSWWTALSAPAPISWWRSEMIET
jgi:hypothetical protein